MDWAVQSERDLSEESDDSGNRSQDDSGSDSGIDNQNGNDDENDAYWAQVADFANSPGGYPEPSPSPDPFTERLREFEGYSPTPSPRSPSPDPAAYDLEVSDNYTPAEELSTGRSRAPSLAPPSSDVPVVYNRISPFSRHAEVPIRGQHYVNLFGAGPTPTHTVVEEQGHRHVTAVYDAIKQSRALPPLPPDHPDELQPPIYRPTDPNFIPIGPEHPLYEPPRPSAAIFRARPSVSFWSPGYVHNRYPQYLEYGEIPRGPPEIPAYHPNLHPQALRTYPQYNPSTVRYPVPDWPPLPGRTLQGPGPSAPVSPGRPNKRPPPRSSPLTAAVGSPSFCPPSPGPPAADESSVLTRLQDQSLNNRRFDDTPTHHPFIDSPNGPLDIPRIRPFPSRVRTLDRELAEADSGMQSSAAGSGIDSALTSDLTLSLSSDLGTPDAASTPKTTRTVEATVELQGQASSSNPVGATPNAEAAAQVPTSASATQTKRAHSSEPHSDEPSAKRKTSDTVNSSRRVALPTQQPSPPARTSQEDNGITSSGGTSALSSGSFYSSDEDSQFQTPSPRPRPWQGEASTQSVADGQRTIAANSDSARRSAARARDLITGMNPPQPEQASNYDDMDCDDSSSEDLDTVIHHNIDRESTPCPVRRYQPRLQGEAEASSCEAGSEYQGDDEDEIMSEED